jgi:nitroimidazol reductase NimA-like FMN-containing flavoprotein (pyridoxamine 5'-phosphate oxidase superfamily)
MIARIKVSVELVDLNTGMEVIPLGECMALLATEEVGRLGVVVGGQPEIFPVNYAVDGDGVVFRTDAGTKLAGATRGPVVFEVDHFERATRSAWSVIIHGRAEPVDSLTSPAIRERVGHLALYPWVEKSKPHLIRVTPTSVSGRRIRPIKS